MGRRGYLQRFKRENA